ncbi:MAG: hypothetical protein KatS3mg043_1533 [Rhodothermaceae bacterium]|nr:MAG: hypothetical protein KatS3mg043_1533 [Rhodothermaceae bacterium]
MRAVPAVVSVAAPGPQRPEQAVPVGHHRRQPGCQVEGHQEDRPVGRHRLHGGAGRLRAGAGSFGRQGAVVRHQHVAAGQPVTGHGTLHHRLEGRPDGCGSGRIGGAAGHEHQMLGAGMPDERRDPVEQDLLGQVARAQRFGMAQRNRPARTRGQAVEQAPGQGVARLLRRHEQREDDHLRRRVCR